MSAINPSRREIELAAAIRDAAHSLTLATNYAETYIARTTLAKAIRDLANWASAGRPHA